DPNTLTIKTDPPLGTLLGTLSLLYVGKADSIDDESYWLKPIGTGPFKIDSYTPDDEIVFSPNENYWGTPPKLTSLTFKDIPEAATRVTGLLTGEIDVVTNIAPDQIEEVRGADGLTLDTVPSYLYWMNWFNHGREPFDDARVRQALWYALDLNTIIP